MNNLKFFLTCIFLIICQLSGVFAQQQVKGLVIDDSNRQPMPFVSIAVIGSTFGTVSNQNGEFTLNIQNIDPSDSIAFHYLGYETIMMKISDLNDGMTVKMKEKPVLLRSIAIVAHPMKPEELIKKAIEKKNENYPQIAQKREVFHRSNTATYFNGFDIQLKKSDIPEFDQNLFREVVDSLPRYSRAYEDNLYNLYSIPADSGKTKFKFEGVKDVILKEDNGGGLERVKTIVNDLFVHKKDDKTFWKYKTGIFSFADVSISGTEPSADSSRLKNRFAWYFISGDGSWNWDFIQKTNRYHYQNKGIIGIGGEDAYIIGFTGKSGADYQGMIYISTESFAILRIEYTLKESKKDKGIDLLGVSYKQEKEEGLLLYEKDKSGYFLKYSMKATAFRYGIDRPFEIIKKQKRPVFSKKLNEVALHLNLEGFQDECNETLVVYRESSTPEKFKKIVEKGVEPERITSYSDSIWKGYSIIEPTRQMKEYRAKIKN